MSFITCEMSRDVKQLSNEYMFGIFDPYICEGVGYYCLRARMAQ